MVETSDPDVLPAQRFSAVRADRFALLGDNREKFLAEANQAALDKVLNPERSPLPGADPSKKAMRDVNMARRLYEIGQFAESVKFSQRALGVAPVARLFGIGRSRDAGGSQRETRVNGQVKIRKAA